MIKIISIFTKYIIISIHLLQFYLMMKYDKELYACAMLNLIIDLFIITLYIIVAFNIRYVEIHIYLISCEFFLVFILYFFTNLLINLNPFTKTLNK